METDNQVHWDNTYAAKGESNVSWFQASPGPSLALIEEAGATPASAIVDVGGGASRLADSLLERGFQNLTVLDLSAAALALAKARLGGEADRVHWIVGDATRWLPPQVYDVWHDRATFHFLVEAADRAAYVARLNQFIRPGGHLVLATFAMDGPEKCSGLPVVRYDEARLSQTLGPAFQAVSTQHLEHTTPWGTMQAFQFSLFRKAF